LLNVKLVSASRNS